MNNLKARKNEKIKDKGKTYGNPFVYGETVTGEYFTDRIEELKALEQDLTDGQTVFLLAPRRYGKTSLIMNLFKKMRSGGVVTLYVDLYRSASFNQFLNQYLTGVLNAFETKFEKVTRFLVELLPSIRPKITVAADGTLSAEVILSPVQKDTSKIALEILELPNILAMKKNKRVAIAIDEFQEIANYNGESVEKMVRSVIQHHRNIGYLFAGSKKHIIKDMVYREDRAFYKAGKMMTIGKIRQQDFARFIMKKFESSGFKIGDGMLEKIFEISNDCPYYVQYLCHELWDRFFETKRVAAQDVAVVLEEVVAEVSSIYITIWDELPLHQRRLLQAIALTGGTNLFSQNFIVTHELGSPSSVQTSVNLLVDKGIIDRENNHFYIDDVFFKHWIIRYGVQDKKDQ